MKGLPAPAARWNGFPKYNFVGGHNDPEGIPVEELIASAGRALRKRGRTLATYNLDGGPLGDREMREFLARSEEHTSELQSLMRISYAVFCLKKKKHT